MSVYPHEIKAVIFDNDGTIIDTLELYFTIMEEMVNDKFSQDFKLSMNGQSDMDVAKLMVKKYNLPYTWEQYLKVREPLLDEKLPDCPIVKGSAELIRKFHEMGVPMAVATSGMRDGFTKKISKKRDIFDLFDTTVCGDEVTTAKPDPTIYLTAAKKLGNYKPEEVLVFEDALIGALAAERAGMPCVLLTETIPDIEAGLKKFNLKRPSHVVSSWTDFDFSWFKFAAKK